MGNKDRVHSKEVGLEIGLVLGKYFLKTEDLHYGFWDDGQIAEPSNFAEAQRRHSEYIISHIPEGTKTILDVGAGAGNFAKKMIDRGFAVDCVIPSQFLAEKLRERLGENSTVYPVKYEDVETDKSYDLIIFSESFAYVNIQKGLEQTRKFLNKDGRLLICDYFSLPNKKKSPIAGGHKYEKFKTAIEESPFEIDVDNDITEQTAPTFDLMNEFIDDVLHPVAQISDRYLSSNYPRIMKLVRWKFRKRLNKLNNKYIGGKLTAEVYKQFKSYRLMTFKLTN